MIKFNKTMTTTTSNSKRSFNCSNNKSLPRLPTQKACYNLFDSSLKLCMLASTPRSILLNLVPRLLLMLLVCTSLAKRSHGSQQPNFPRRTCGSIPERAAPSPSRQRHNDRLHHLSRLLDGVLVARLWQGPAKFTCCPMQICT